MHKKLMNACKGKVIVQDLDSGEQILKSGIVLTNDDGKLSGIHARWAKVHSIGEGVEDIQEGEWILISHGRWSRTIEIDGVKLNLVDYPKGVLAASPERPDSYVGLGN